MNKILITTLWALTVLGAAPPARAETSEMTARFFVGNELGIVHHPLADYAQSSGSKIYLPRVGLRSGIGLTHWFDLGIGLDVGLPQDVVARNVRFQKIRSGDLYARYYDVWLPATALLHFDTGHDLSVALGGSAGFVFAHWAERYMLDSGSPDNPFAQGKPIDQGEAWHSDLFVRVEAPVTWRPLDWFSFSMYPYASRTLRGDAYLGIGVEANFLWGVGFH